MLCAGCPVTAECLSAALDYPPTTARWAGTTARGRTAMRAVAKLFVGLQLEIRVGVGQHRDPFAEALEARGFAWTSGTPPASLSVARGCSPR